MSQTRLPSPRLTDLDRARLFSHVVKTATCHIWMGAVGRDGYGRFWLSERGRDRMVTPHAAAATLTFGPLPLGSTVMHDCDVRICVSTEQGHVRSATQGANMQQAARRGRAAGTRPGLVDVRGKVGASRAVQEALRAVAGDDLSDVELAGVLAEVLAAGDPLRSIFPLFDTLPGGRVLSALDGVDAAPPVDLLEYAARLPPAPTARVESVPLFDE